MRAVPPTFEGVNESVAGPSPSGREGGPSIEVAPGEGRKSNQILRPSPYPLPEGEGKYSVFQFIRSLPACAAGAGLLLLVASYLSAQITSSIPYTGQYNRGQDVVPVYEGWKPNPDGTFTMYFGYFNRNYQEEIDIPLGANNS